MKNFTKSLSMMALLFGLFVSNQASAQIVFSEDFSGGALPAGWAVYDVDGLTPDANVAQYTSAWIVDYDFTNTGDYVASSTSWYSPPGTSDDWIATSVVALTTNNVLRWEANAQDPNFPDGYEVYISTSGNTVADFTGPNGNMIFSIAAESNPWTARSVDLQAAGYSNQNAYFAWRNNSTDQFILLIDSIRVESSTNPSIDAEMVANGEELTQVAMSQVYPLGTIGDINNIGATTLSNVNMTVNIYDGALALVTSIPSVPVATMAAGTGATFTTPGYTPTAPDTYTIEYVASMLETDDNPLDNTVSYQIIVTDSTDARDDAIVLGALGIGAGNGGYLGQQFTASPQDTLTSASVFLVNSGGYMAGQPLYADIFDMSAGTPNVVIATTDTLILDTTQNMLYTLMIPGGLVVNGDFVIAFAEVDSTQSIAYTLDNFTPATTWLNWPTIPTGGWDNNETFGFNNSYIIRANFGTMAAGCDGSLTATATSTDETTIGGNDGTASATVVGGTSPYTYDWQPGGATTASINGLAPGTYVLVVTDAMGCTDSTSVVVNAAQCDPSFAVSVSGTDETTIGANDGTATAAVSGGSAPYSYMWSPSGGTASVATGLAPGTYTVTVTDAIGCTEMGTVVINPAGCDPLYDVTASSTNETANGANDGIAMATVTGGTAPFVYDWQPGGGTTASISNLAPGIYTVTVTDSLGCTAIDTTEVLAGPIGIGEATAGITFNAFPNPVSNVLNLNITAENAENLNISITNVIGAEIWSTEANSVTTWNKTIDTQAWAPGVYHVTVNNGMGNVVYQIVKN